MRYLRYGLAFLLLLALVPGVLALGASLVWHEMARDPSYLMGALRGLDVLDQVKAEFLDSLVTGSGLPEEEEAALRETLDEGVPTEWLDGQLERVLESLSQYLVSDGSSPLSSEVPVVELKSFLLASFREHLGEEYYLSAVLGLAGIPDTVDVGELAAEAGLAAGLERARPYWRWAYLAPAALGGAALIVTAAIWALAGRRAGAKMAGGGFMAAGVLTLAVGFGLDFLAGRYLAALLPINLPELQSLPIRNLVLTLVSGLRTDLAAAGAMELLAGVFIARVLGRLVARRGEKSLLQKV